MAKKEVVIEVEIESLQPSPTNPRKVFTEAELKDLAESIKEKGILSPLVVRTHSDYGLPPGSLEIVCGERRFRAAKLAGLATVPCMARELTDQQVIEIQVIENMQREGLTPLEEAKGYQALHEQYKYDWPELAAKIGKSQEYIFNRMGLLQLIPALQKKLQAGELKLTWAEYISKLLNSKEQEQILQDLGRRDGYTAGFYGDTLEKLKEHIADEYLLQLARAPFPAKDKNLTGGPCTACPKRTGANPDLFGDLVGKNDTCQDKTCWAAKKKEYEARLKSKYQKYIDAGHKVLIGEAAEKVLRDYHDTYKELDDTSYNYLKSKITWAQALKDTEYKTLIVVDEKGVVHEKVHQKTAIKYVPENKKATDAPKAKPQTPEEKAAYEKKQKEAELVSQASILAYKDALRELVGKAKDIDLNAPDVLRFVLSRETRDLDEDQFEVLKELAGSGDYKKMKPVGLKPALLMILIADSYNTAVSSEGTIEDDSKAAFDFFGITQTFKDQVKMRLAELKAEQEKPVKKAKGGKK